MYKYIGTEQHLLDLGFEKCTKLYNVDYRMDFSKDDNTLCSVFQIYKKEVDIRVDNRLDLFSDKAFCLLAKMINRGLVVWEQ